MVCSPTGASGEPNWRGGGGDFQPVGRRQRPAPGHADRRGDADPGRRHHERQYFRAEDEGQLAIDVLTDLPRRDRPPQTARATTTAWFVLFGILLASPGRDSVVKPGPGAKVSHAVDISDRIADLASAFLTQAVVTRKTALSDHFVRVDLQSDKFRSALVDARLQGPAAAGNRHAGHAHLHPVRVGRRRGHDLAGRLRPRHRPGLGWFDQVKPGDPCELMGPRRSLDLTGLASLGGLRRRRVQRRPGRRAPRDQGRGRHLRPGGRRPGRIHRGPGGSGRHRDGRAEEQPRPAQRPGSGAYDLVVTGDAATVGPLAARGPRLDAPPGEDPRQGLLGRGPHRPRLDPAR